MTGTPYPFPREIRQTEVLNGTGVATYGPFAFRVFDEEDVKAFIKPDGREVFEETPVTVTKTSGEPFDTFTVTFAEAVAPETRFVIQAARVHERQAAITKGGAISTDQLEKELSKQGTVVEELRRDVDRTFKPGFGENSAFPGWHPGSPIVWDNNDPRLVNGPSPEEGRLLGWHNGRLANRDVIVLPNAPAGTTGLDVLAAETAEDVFNTVVGDGSISDDKVATPATPADGVSASKLKYLASTSAGAIASAVARDTNLKLSDSLDAKDFGVTADGTTDDTAAMVASLAAMEATGAPLFLPPGVIMVDPDALVVGDGSAAGASSAQAPALIGAGFAPYTRKGTVIKARQAGTLLFDVQGLLEGFQLYGVQFDCAGIVNEGVRITSAVGFDWNGFGIYDFIDVGFRSSNRTEPYPGSVTWSCNNHFQRFFITSAHNRVYSSGILLSGTVDPDTPPGPHDMHRSLFSNGVVQMNKVPEAAGCQGLFFGFVDSSQFREVDVIMVGTGTGYSATFSDQDNVGLPYPQNMLFIGCSLGGDAPRVLGTPGNNYFFHYAMKDGEGLPSNTQFLRGFTDDGRFFGPHSIDELVKELALVGATAADRTVRFMTPDGVHAAKMVHNSTLGLEVQVFDGTSYETYCRFTPSGDVYLNFSGLGLKHLQAGDPDSDGTGFRSVRIPN